MKENNMFIGSSTPSALKKFSALFFKKIFISAYHPQVAQKVNLYRDISYKK